MRFVRHYDLGKTKSTPRWGFVYTKRISAGNPQNIDIFLGNHLFAFWGKHNYEPFKWSFKRKKNK